LHRYVAVQSVYSLFVAEEMLESLKTREETQAKVSSCVSPLMIKVEGVSPRWPLPVLLTEADGEVS